MHMYLFLIGMLLVSLVGEVWLWASSWASHHIVNAVAVFSILSVFLMVWLPEVLR